MSEWLLFNTNSAIFQLYHGEDKLIFNEMKMRSTLYYTNTLSWIFIVLTDWQSADRHIVPLGHIVQFLASQSLLFLLNTACLAEKLQIPINSLWFDPIGPRTHDLSHSSRTH
jgi:hypothetical protein